MAQARCPHCSRFADVPDYLAFGLIRCPDCQHTFSYQAGVLPEPLPPVREPEPTPEPVLLGDLLPFELVPEPVPALPLQALTMPPSPSADLLAAILAEPVRTTPLPRTPPTPTPGQVGTPGATAPSATPLVEPHICQHCRSAIHQPINREKATFTCPHVACSRTTYAYAVQFKCGACNLLLEAPTRLGGSDRPCPVCHRTTTVPVLVLANTAPRGEDPADLFACECPNCATRLVTRRDAANLSAVCTHCKVVIRVPNYGTPLTGAREAVHVDTRATLKSVKLVACGVCEAHIPASARACPLCKSPNRPGLYPT